MSASSFRNSPAQVAQSPGEGVGPILHVGLFKVPSDVVRCENLLHHPGHLVLCESKVWLQLPKAIQQRPMSQDLFGHDSSTMQLIPLMVPDEGGPCCMAKQSAGELTIVALVPDPLGSLAVDTCARHPSRGKGLWQ
eukprot:13174672-Alexandrium_andersonii.AAC.1